MSKSRDKRIKVMQDGKPRKDRKVELWEREFDSVALAIDYALSIANQPLAVDHYDSVKAKHEHAPHDLVYWTERISLGGNRWVIRVSTWIPKSS